MAVLTRNLWIGPMVCALLGFGVLIYLVRQAPMGTERLLPAPAGGYRLTAKFDNIGDLKVGSPLTIGGVKIGSVEAIRYEPHVAKAVVTLRVGSVDTQLPDDSDAQIHSQSLLGGKRVQIVPGGSAVFLAEGGELASTTSTVPIETMVKRGLEAFKDRKVHTPQPSSAPGS